MFASAGQERAALEEALFNKLKGGDRTCGGRVGGGKSGTWKFVRPYFHVCKTVPGKEIFRLSECMKFIPKTIA